MYRKIVFNNVSKKIVLLLVTLILVSLNISNIFAQSQGDDNTRNPKIIPPGPEAQAFKRYGEYPVDYSTGVTKIDIPLYDIKSGKLDLPISLTYHASGIHVNDVASVVGLGWRLNAGGALTRTVKGFPDESFQGIINHPFLTEQQIEVSKYPSNPGYNATEGSLVSIAYGFQDGESDSYYYAAGNSISGDFVYDNALNITPLSYSSNKIIRHQLSNTYPYGFWFEVIGDDGTQYIFDKKELSYEGANPETYPSSWWLSKIISADKADEISFEYDVSNIDPHVDIAISQSWDFHTGITNDNNTGLLFSFQHTNTYQVVLKKINFKNGYVLFDYQQDRKDMQENRLNSVAVYNSTSSLPIIKHQLSQSNFWSGYADDKYNYRMKLDELKTFDANNTYINHHLFEYNEDHILPPYSNSNVYIWYQNASYAVDYYGYYNGQVQNWNMIPNLPAPFSTSSANRIPNEPYAKSCILNKITYPTGGTTLFDYESNIGHDGNITGGLRIKSILSKADNTSLPTKKTFEYLNNLLYTDMDLYGNYSYFQGFSLGPQDYEPRTVYTDNPVIPYQMYNGSCALYEIVNEYSENSQNDKLKTTYTYNSESNSVYSINSPRYSDQYYIDRAWRRGLLGGTYYYKLFNGEYKLTRSIDNTYSDYQTNTFIEGLKVHPRTVQTYSANGQGLYGCGNAPSNPITDCFFYFNTKMEIGIKKLTQQIISEQDENGNLLTKTSNYSYASPNHLFPTTKTYLDSKNNTISETYKYVYDYAGTPVYDKMIAENVVSPVIENTITKNTSFIKSNRTNYNFWDNGWGNNTSNSIIVPQTVESRILNNTYEARLRYHSYDDKGNVTSVSKENDVKSSYLWGYNKTYPVAQVVGSNYSTISGLVTQSVLDNPSSDAALRSELNNLRTGLATTTALVTTYTYKPLVGMTSQTDANGRTVYYEYDVFGRLKLIRDQNNKILKKYCYNYAGQAENCAETGIVGNEAKSVVFTKECAVGSGSAVPYSVAADTYFAANLSTANQLAQDDINVNGQQYANDHGTCTGTTPSIYARLGIYPKAYNDFYSPTLTDYWQQVAVYVEFFSDPECIHEYILPADVIFHIHSCGYSDTPDGYTNGCTYLPDNFVAHAGSSNALVDDILPYESLYFTSDANGVYTYYEKFKYDWYISPIGGNVIMKPTHSEITHKIGF